MRFAKPSHAARATLGQPTNDVPSDINGIPFSALGTETVKVLRNGRLYILKPDGKLYSVDGVLQR